MMAFYSLDTVLTGNINLIWGAFLFVNFNPHISLFRIKILKKLPVTG